MTPTDDTPDPLSFKKITFFERTKKTRVYCGKSEHEMLPVLQFR